jgi:hypothetical protein
MEDRRMADWQKDSNAHCREHDASALCATCGKTWGNHIGRCCDGDESSPRRFKLAAPPQGVRDLIEQLCSAAVAYGERADGEQAYYAAKAKLIEATRGVSVVGSQPSSSHTTGKVRGTEGISFDPAQGPEVTER